MCTDNPTLNPSIIPTKIPIDTTGLSSTWNSSTKFHYSTDYSYTSTSDHDATRGTIVDRTLSTIGFVVVVVTCAIILFIRLIYTKIPQYKNIDMPHFGYVLKFVFQIVDVLSDISVAELMFINDDIEYFYMSITFIILPLVIAICCLFYFKLYEWNFPSNKNILKKYAVPQ